jgi:phosphoglycerate dehydrogenase-like enzyme
MKPASAAQRVRDRGIVETARMRIGVVTPLETEWAARIIAAAGHNEVWFQPRLLPAPRYPSDHRGDPSFARSPADDASFWHEVAQCEILYGVPGDTAAGLARAIASAPKLRWVQGTAAGAGEQVRAAALAPEVFARIAFTSAAGVHGGMLAEFIFFGLLALRKDARRLERIRAERRWDHYAMGELDGSSIAIVGMGSIGRAIASRARAFGMQVFAVTRSGVGSSEVDGAFSTARMPEAFRRADAVAVTLPATEQTHGLVDRAALDALRPSAIFCNVGRGSVVDQAALAEKLSAGAIAGAVLDVCDPEPLPPEHPLWSLPNVIFAPHTAALSVHENERIVELFCDNLQRFEAGLPLRNRIDAREFY